MPDPAELIPLFSTPVFKARIETHSITPDHINELEYTVYPDGTGKQSKNTKVLLSEPFTQLKIDIDKYLNAFVFDTLKIGQGNLVHVQSWINMHDPGDHAPKHHHINSCYSGVYYIQRVLHTWNKSLPIRPKVISGTHLNGSSQPKQEILYYFLLI